MMAIDIPDYRVALRLRASEQSNSVAIIDGVSGREYKYSSLLTQIERVGAALIKDGLKPGDRLVSTLPNSIEQFLTFLAAVEIGLDFAPLTPQTTSRELSSLTALLEPTMVIMPSTAPSELEIAARTRTKRIHLNGEFDWVSGETVPLERSTSAGELLIATSGTTGAPKMMRFNVSKLWASGQAFMAELGLDGTNFRFLNNLPQSYLGGLFNLGLLPLSTGGSTVLTESFSGRSFLTFWRQVEQFEISAIWLTPTIARGLLELAPRTKEQQRLAQASKIRAALIGTAPIDLQTKNTFKKMFGLEVLENYALSETTFLTTERPESLNNRTEGSVGGALSYVSLKLRNTDEASGVGEILARSPYSFEGYYGAENAVAGEFTDEGFFATGDLGRFSKDGELVLAGRVRDIIKKGGYMLVLREIEVLSESHPQIAEAAAIPIQHAFYGEDYLLQLRLISSEPKDFSAFLVEFRAWLAERLAAYKLPGDIAIVDDFPRTDSGKIQKRLLARSISGTVG